MVFVEFVSAKPIPGERLHFVGATLDDVLADTEGGTRFGYGRFESHRVITEEEVRSLGLGYIEQGISSVQTGRAKSFKLGPVPH